MPGGNGGGQRPADDCLGGGPNRTDGTPVRPDRDGRRPGPLRRRIGFRRLPRTRATRLPTASDRPDWARAGARMWATPAPVRRGRPASTPRPVSRSRQQLDLGSPSIGGRGTIQMARPAVPPRPGGERGRFVAAPEGPPNLEVAAHASVSGTGTCLAMSNSGDLGDQGGEGGAQRGSASAGVGGSAPRKTLTPEEVTRGMEIDPTDVNIYRGGVSLQARAGVDIQIDKATGLVKLTHGLSLDVDAAAMQRFGGAFQVESIPPELRIVQRGSRPGHFEIVPRQAMTPERFQELANQIKLTPSGG
jgi:hypothetical protein